MNEKNKFGGLSTIYLPDLLYSYRESDVSRENKRNKSTKQNREAEIDPHKYDHLNFAKKQRQCNGEKTSIPTNAAGRTGQTLAKKNLDTYLTSFCKTNCD